MRKRLIFWKHSLNSLLILALILSTCTTAIAGPATDIQNHWAEKQLSEWMEKGYITGYSDGSVLPDKTVTRGEFITFINRSFDFKEAGAVNFKDIDSSSWDYEEIAKALKAGYISGYEDNTIRSNNTITRQEAAVILKTLLMNDASPVAEKSEKFIDESTISSWGINAVHVLSSKGIVNGYEDGTYRPNQSITRAEAVVTIDRVKSASGITYNKVGLYGPANGVDMIQGDVVISVEGVTIQNLIINGNLLLDSGIGTGDVFLNNITVKGTTTVKGGGENSVHFKDSVLVKVIINKKEGTVRIVAEGTTKVQTIEIESSVKIEQSLGSTALISNVKLMHELPENSKVTLIGKFDSVDIFANSINVEIPSGMIGDLNVNKGAEGASINLGNNAVIVNMVLNAVVKVLGDGKIEKATINDGANGSEFENKPTVVDGVQKDSIKETKPVFGGGGGGSVSPTPKITTAPVSSEIHTYNYFTGNDEVHYENNMPVGSTLKVYDAATGGSIIGSSNSNHVTVTNGFSTVISNVYVSLTETGKLESERVVQKIATAFPISPNSLYFDIRNYRVGDDRIIHNNLPSDSIVNFYDGTGNRIDTTTASKSPYSIMFNVDHGFNSVASSVYAAYTVTEDTYAYVESKRTELRIPSPIEKINTIVGTDQIYTLDQFGNYLEFLSATSSNYSVVRANFTNDLLTVSSLKPGFASVNIVVRKENGEAYLISFDVDVTAAP
ncbi:S-layer homology domain-containing protein [Paenibacillus phytorum]|nr:S-layer homology domain-containing protein [Paenibacillus phytorum]